MERDYASCTLEEILATPRLGGYVSVLFPAFILKHVPRDMYSLTLRQLGEQLVMPFGGPFPAQQLVDTINLIQEALEEETLVFTPLWHRDDFCPGPEGKASKSNVCLISSQRAFTGRRPAVIICPGGGYEGMSSLSEGLDVLRVMEQRGYRGFVLAYRVNPARYPQPQQDLALALLYLRRHARQLGIAEDDIMTLGFSAGGHLCASVAASAEEYAAQALRELGGEDAALASEYTGISARPDKACLCYPVISFEKEQHEGSFTALTGGNEALRQRLSVEQQADGTYPPSFLWACADDMLVPPSNAERLAAALQRANVPYALKLYPNGGHGCGLAQGTSAAGWLDDMLGFFAGE